MSGSLLDIILIAIGLLITGAGAGRYLMGRRKRRSDDLPPEKPPADEIAPPVPDIAPTPDEVKELDERTAKTDAMIEEVIDLEEEIEDTIPPPNEPDEDVVDFLKRQRDDSE